MKLDPLRRTSSSLHGALVLALVACGDAGESGTRASAADDQVGERATAGEPGFRAEVTGAVSGSIEGPGVIEFLPPAEVPSGTRPGYYFISDIAGGGRTASSHSLGITFSIPADRQPGVHRLVSASPLEGGRHFEVRVDHLFENSVVSYERDTEGTITLTSMPASPAEIVGGRVSGHFRFSTRNGEGAKVQAEGSFEFTGR